MIKDRAHRRPYRAIAITIADHDTKVSLSSRSLLGADNEMLPVSTCIMNRIQLEVAIIWHESHACISWIGNALSFIGQNYGLLPAYINITQHNTGLKWRRRCVVSVKNHYHIMRRYLNILYDLLSQPEITQYNMRSMSHKLGLSPVDVFAKITFIVRM